MSDSIGTLPFGTGPAPLRAEPALPSQAEPLVPSAALESAIRLALSCHAGQVDKAGEPYILHPLRIMLGGRTEVERIVGVLHDTVEDSGLEVEDVQCSFGDEIGEAVDAMTKRKGETYTSFILRCAENPIARIVKLRDLEDNMWIERLGREPTIKDLQRQQKYIDARALLMTIGCAQRIEAQRATTAGRGSREPDPEGDAPNLQRSSPHV